MVDGKHTAHRTQAGGLFGIDGYGWAGGVMLKSVRFADLLPDEVESTRAGEQDSGLLYAIEASPGNTTTLVVLGRGGSCSLSPDQLRQLVGLLTDRLAVVEA